MNVRASVKPICKKCKVIRRKGVALDGSHPTLLYGYGGYGISMTPAFLGAEPCFAADAWGAGNVERHGGRMPQPGLPVLDPGAGQPMDDSAGVQLGIHADMEHDWAGHRRCTTLERTKGRARGLGIRNHCTRQHADE